MLTILTDLSANIVAFAAGMIFWKNLHLPHRIIWLQIAIALMVELFARIWLPQHNGVIYSYYLLIDGLLLMLAGYFFLKGNSKYWVGISGLLYFIYWSITPLPVEFSKVYVLSSAIQVAVYFFVLYYAVIGHRTALYRLPELWIALGVIIFYAGNIPYFSVANLTEKLSTAQRQWLHYILVFLAQGRYLCMAIGFYFTKYLQKENRQHAVR